MGPGYSAATLQVLVVDSKFILKEEFIFKLGGIWIPDLSCHFYLCLWVILNSLSKCHFLINKEAVLLPTTWDFFCKG